MKIDPDENYPEGSLGAELLHIRTEVNAAYPGAGDALLAYFNANWTPLAEIGLDDAYANVMGSDEQD